MKTHKKQGAVLKASQRSEVVRTNTLTASVLYNLYERNYSAFVRRPTINDNYGHFAAAFLRGATRGA